MIGLMFLVLFALWLWLAIWLAKKINQFFWREKGLSGAMRLGRSLSLLALAALMFLLPFIDQLIAYPKWQQLCSTTGDFEWGPGMDAKKANGRELVVTGTIHETNIFPNIKVTYFSRQFKDAQTGELILNMPHASYYKARGMFYLPTSSGNNQAIFLPQCTTTDKDQKITDYLNQFDLKVIEYKN